MDPAQNLSRAMPVIFTMAMGPMRLVVVIGDPTIMFDAHLFPRLGFSKVKISHSSLDIDYVELSLPAVVPSPLRPLRWRSRPVSARRGADLQRRPPGAAPAGGAALAPGAPAAHLAGGAARVDAARHPCTGPASPGAARAGVGGLGGALAALARGARASGEL